MAIVVKERIPGGIGVRREGNNITVVERWEYNVHCSNREETRLNVITAAGLPIVGLTTTTSGAVCESKDGDRDPKNPFLWRVKVGFSSGRADQQPSEDPEADPTDPLTWRPIWKVRFDGMEEMSTTDFRGNPRVNSANQPFSSPGKRKRLIASTDFFQFETSDLTLDEIMDRSGRVNETEFNGFSPYTLMLVVKNADLGTWANTLCWRVDYTLMYKRGLVGGWSEWSSDFGGTWTPADVTKKSGWRNLLLDVGPCYIDSTTLVPFKAGNVAYEGKLDGTGGRLGDDATPVILGFEEDEPIEFSDFLRI